MEQNKSIKKFIRKAKKDFTFFAAKIDKKIRLAADTKVIESFKSKDILSNSKIFTDDVVNSMTNVMLLEEAELVDACTDLKDIIEKIESEEAFADFILLEKYLNKYYFTEEEKLEVYAYLLRQNIDFVANIENQILIDLDLKDKSDNEAKEFLNEQMPLSFLIEVTMAGGHVENLCGLKITDIFDAFAGLGEYVSETGKFLPNVDFARFYDLLKYTFLKMTNKQACLMIKACTKQFLSAVKEVDNKAHEEVILTEEVSKEDIKPNYVERKKLYDEKRKAIELIKLYFNDDQVITFVTDEALEKIVNALNMLGYSQKKIEAIKLAIKEYNAKYEAELENKDFVKSKEIYLTADENNFLTEVETILFSEDPVMNSLFISLHNNYSFLKELLLKLYDFKEDDSESLNDLTDLIDITLEDLKEVFENYKLTDYRVLRALKKKEK